MMKTGGLSDRQAEWHAWAKFLRRKGWGGLTEWLLEAAGPFNLIAAQVLYFGGALLRPVVSDGKMQLLALLLEDPQERQAFISLLHEMEPS